MTTMMTKLPLFFLLIGASYLTTSVVSQSAYGQEEAQAETVPMIEIAKPTKNHKNVLKELGTWEGEMTMNLGPTPLQSKCTEINRRLGPFWMTTNFVYELNGKTMRGHGQFAYNKAEDKYVGTWVDSASDTISLMSGKYDESKRTMTYTTKSKDPTGQEVDMRMVSTMTSDTTKEFEMSMKAPDQVWITIMTVKYKKVGSKEK